MDLSPELFVDLVPLQDFGGVPFSELLVKMMEAELDPARVRAALETINKRLPAPVLRPQCVEDGGYLVEEQVLVPRKSTWWFVLQDAEERLSTELDAESVPVVADFLRLAAHAQDEQKVRAAWPFDGDEWLGRLFTRRPDARWLMPQTPGIYRLEHATLLIRSRTTGILLDPISLQRRLPNMKRLMPRMPTEAVNAVAITHGHVDHWHLPSLLANLPRPEVPVVVPRVAYPSLLTFEDFHATLKLVGQETIAPAWGGMFRVGDIEVDVLPFYGEQPLREGDKLREGLRSWGNCYRFTTEDFSCLVLVDAGADPEGDMVQVVAESQRRRGPVDAVLACQRTFLSPFFGGLSHYWAAMPWSQLQGLYRDYKAGRLRSSTASPQGAAEACVAAHARYFLGYANGFEGMHSPITDVGWGDGEPSEERCNTLMREALGKLGGSTQVLEWRPGQVARFDKGQLTVEPLALSEP
ncbi:MAG TPA: MBL fold metallo-hydrolase [Hyalangium sp.]|nr:MBL fold metallo-hydrolase [Hyalangium sp.]